LKKIHRRLITAAVMLLFFSVLATLRWSHPHEISAIPECPSMSLAGVYCPGCGSLRATHHLVNGRVGSSLAQNPITLLVGVPMVGLAGLMLLCWCMERPPPGWVRSRRLAWGLIGVGALLIAYGIVRNVDAEWARWMQPADQRAEQRMME